jgi:hypothetical protein
MFNYSLIIKWNSISSWISYEIVLEWDKVKKFSERYNYPWDYHLATSPKDTPDSYTHPINIGFHDREHKSNNIWQNHFEYSVIKKTNKFLSHKCYFDLFDKIQE